MEEYRSNLEEKINNLDEHSLNSEQKEIQRLLVRKEKELDFKIDKFKKITTFFSTIAIIISLLAFALIGFVIHYETKQLKQTALAKDGVFQVLRELQTKIQELKSTRKPQKVFTKQHNTVKHKGKKYLKILKTDFMELSSQPKYRYLRLK